MQLQKTFPHLGLQSVLHVLGHLPDWNLQLYSNEQWHLSNWTAAHLFSKNIPIAVWNGFSHSSAERRSCASVSSEHLRKNVNVECGKKLFFIAVSTKLPYPDISIVSLCHQIIADQACPNFFFFNSVPDTITLAICACCKILTTSKAFFY